MAFRTGRNPTARNHGSSEEDKGLLSIHRRRLWIVSTEFPTKTSPYQGRPIWATLEALQQVADLRVLCPMPKSPALLRRILKPRSYHHWIENVDNTGRAVFGKTIHYLSIPGVTHRLGLHGPLLSRSLRKRLDITWGEALIAYAAYPAGYAAVRFGRRFGIPTIISALGSDLKCLVPGSRVERQVQYAMRHADAIIAVSEDLGRAAEDLGAPRNLISVVSNGVDCEAFSIVDRASVRSELGIPLDQKVVLYVGNLVPVKGVSALPDTLARLCREGTDWKLVLIGDGPLRNQLANAFRKLGVSEKILFLGQQEPGVVANWMNAANALLLPSLSEGCPNVILEAFACGCPVVATAVGGIPSMVNEANGILVDANEPAALSTALEAAIGANWDRARIRSCSQRSWQDVASETLAICESVISSRGAIV